MKRTFRQQVKQAKKNAEQIESNVKIQQEQLNINNNILIQNLFMQSEEQKAYIQRPFNQNEDSILLAKAGSGKTQCLLDRMKYLAQIHGITKDQMLVFSFCKLTIEDTKNRCKKYGDASLFSDDKYIVTIDAFCRYLIHKIEQDRESCDKNVLSAKVHDMISKQDEVQTRLIKYLQKSKFRKIKAIFIDEAQDLNQIQYDIIIFLKKVLKCQLNFIGDPNQNIYQFNGSFEKFILNHEGIKFQLTKNFRSHPQIEQFAKYFEHYNDQLPFETVGQVQETKLKFDNQVELYIQSQQMNNDSILTILENLKKEGHQLKNIAFLSPIEGNQYNTGLKRVANILDKNNISYNAYYRETKDSGKKNTNTNSKQAVNLLTIHGSKGLEYNVVILLHFSDNMMNQDKYEHSNFVAFNMNLLYVALTRAKQKLIIMHDDQQNIIQRHICSLIHRVPENLYKCHGNIKRHLDMIQNKSENRKKLVDEDYDFMKGNQINDNKSIMLVSKYYQPELLEINLKEGMFQNSSYRGKTGVTKFIQGIDKQSLLFLHENLLYKKKCIELYNVSDKDTKLFKDLRYDNEALVGIMLEQLFFYQIQYHKQQNSPTKNCMPKISKILFLVKDSFNYGLLKINQFFVISSIDQFKSFISIIQNIKNNPNISQQMVDEQFKQLSVQIITDDQYDILQQQIQQNLIEYLDFGTISLQQVVMLNQYISQIFDAIDNYNLGLHWSKSIQSIIYICSLKYSIKSKHSKYIKYNKSLIDKLKQFEDLFQNLDQFAITLKDQIVIYQKEIDNYDIIGFIDFIVIDPETQETTIVEFKTTNDLAIEHILQTVMYDYLLQQTQETDNNNRLVIINALKGVQYEIRLEQKDELYEFLTQLLSEDKFQRINVV